MQHKILRPCTHANQFWKQSKLVQHLPNCHAVADEKGGVAKSDTESLNLDKLQLSEVIKCYSQEKAAIHSPAANGIDLGGKCVRRDASEGPSSAEGHREMTLRETPMKRSRCVL